MNELRTELQNLRAVSIHIRHCWRMKYWQEQHGLTPGVSIHIRHCWRMNSRTCRCGVAVARRFNPHSPLLANELFGYSAGRKDAEFQSTFAIAGE